MGDWPTISARRFAQEVIAGELARIPDAPLNDADAILAALERQAIYVAVAPPLADADAKVAEIEDWLDDYGATLPTAAAQIRYLLALRREERTWRGLLAFLDEHYPGDVFLPDPKAPDQGPRIIWMARQIARVREVLDSVGPVHPVHEHHDQCHTWNADCLVLKLRATLTGTGGSDG